MVVERSRIYDEAAAGQNRHHLIHDDVGPFAILPVARAAEDQEVIPAREQAYPEKRTQPESGSETGDAPVRGAARPRRRCEPRDTVIDQMKDVVSNGIPPGDTHRPIFEQIELALDFEKFVGELYDVHAAV